jgi:hypothetical protein
MSVDLRRFDYALEPLLRLKGWQLEALRARLGRLQSHIAEVQREIAGARDALQEQGRQAGQILLERCDPASHFRNLHWLQRQRARIAALSGQLSDLQSERTLLLEGCRTQQRNVEAIEAHREAAVVEFTRGEAARLASAADRDWLARPGTRASVSTSGVAQ